MKKLNRLNGYTLTFYNNQSRIIMDDAQAG